MRRFALISALVFAAAGLVGAVSAGAGSSTKKVQLSDIGNPHYDPANLRIRKGGRVKWIWGPEASAAEGHDVKLTKAPNGVKKFRSPLLGPGDTYAHSFKTPGKYHLICTIHTGTMQMDVRVRR
jgi:plastocyanin